MPLDINESLKFWDTYCWSQNLSPWHLREPHPHLVKYIDRFEDQKCRVLVPLCGKSVDLKYLYERGHEVVGVEGIPEAIEAFFRESGLHYTKSQFEKSGYKYETEDKKLTIIEKNFFELGSTYHNYFDCVWDRGSFVAIERAHRQLYADTIKGLLKSEFSYLLSTVEYDSSKETLPPYSLSKNEILKSVRTWADIETLELFDQDPPYFHGQQLEWFKIGLYLLTNKSTESN